MSSPIRLKIRGHNAETDAPTVEDLLAQVGDWFSILRGVEEALADDGVSEIEWRVTGASKNSPLAFEMTPFPRVHGMDIERRALQVKERTASGLVQLQAQAERPSYFTDQVLEKVEKLFRRVTNGLDLTAIEFGDNVPAVEIGPVDARAAAKNVVAARVPKDKPYQEIGMLEGTLQSVERDGYGRPLLHLKLRINGETVKCILGDAAKKEIEHREIADIWESQRVRVFGTISYKALGHITQILCDSVQLLKTKGELPTASDITDENFTGGLKSEDYLEKLRNGQLS